jgi:hypothetical protein
VKFLAALVEVGALNPSIIISTAALILGLNQPNPGNHIIRVQRPKRAEERREIVGNPGDFFRVSLVCALMTSALPALLLHFNGERGEYVASGIQRIVSWVQLFCLIRAPIPAYIALDIADLLERYQASEFQRFIETFERLDQISSIAAYMADQKFFVFEDLGPYGVPIVQTTLGQRVEQNRPRIDVLELDEESSETDDEAESEAAFRREMDELKEQLEQERKAQTLNSVGRKIAFPIELLKPNQESQNGAMPKMTTLAPPAEFQVTVPKGSKSETMVFKWPAPSVGGCTC